MEKHLEVKGVRDGKAHCTCGWESSFGGKFTDHVNQFEPMTLTQTSRTRHLVTTEFKETYSFPCSCGKPVYLNYNGGELDSSTCSCGVYWELESPVIEIWSTPKR